MLSKQTFTISDVSQQTGVAAVTLRAWERRYGLIKPQRTAKGHRIYSQDNINFIQQILSWLNRGVAISKVATLLTGEQVQTSIVTNDDHWLQIRQDLLAEITNLKQRSLNPLLDQLNKSTPLLTLCEHVYQPLQDLLMQRWQQQPVGYQLEQQVWQQCWQRQTMIMTLRADKQKMQGSCYLANIEIGKTSIDYWLFYALLLQVGIRVIAMDSVTDIAGLTRLNTDIDHLILFADKRLEGASVNHLAKLVQTWQGDIICTGRMADIHSKQLTGLDVDCAGGSTSDCWQTAVMQAWMARIKEA